MIASDAVCSHFDSQLQNFGLWPEELFVWAAAIMDDVKERGDEYMPQIGRLWKEHYRTFRSMDKDVPVEELQLVVSLVLNLAVLMLHTSRDSVHRYMGKLILDSVSMNYDAWEKPFVDMSARCNMLTPEMTLWTNDFMSLDNDRYLTDEIEALFAPPPAPKTVTPAPAKTQTTIKVVSNVFTYKWAKTYPERVLEFYQYLVKLRAIDQDTNHEEFEKLFMGEPTDIIVKWLAPKSALAFLMRVLKKRGYVTPATRIWMIAQSHFKGSDNKLFTDLRNQHDPDYLEKTINVIADVLDPKKMIKPLNMLDDDLAQELWSGIKDKGWEI